ncbi:MAG: hypothetical protein Aurels2KO_50740 [Aureliella sp.]
MLVLSRRPGEEILIGDNIRLKVVAARGNRIQIAIDAPKEVPICRAELEKLQPLAARKSA